jgi:hypothetical protein
MTTSDLDKLDRLVARIKALPLSPEQIRLMETAVAIIEDMLDSHPRPGRARRDK